MSIYTVVTKSRGPVLLVIPAVFCQRAETNKYHLYADSAPQALVKVPVIYIEDSTLFVHELWPFKLAELPEGLPEITSVVALSSNDLTFVISYGYANYAAFKIKGD